MVFDCVRLTYDNERKLNSIWLSVVRTQIVQHNKFKMARFGLCRPQLTILPEILCKKLKLRRIVSVRRQFPLKHSVRWPLNTIWVIFVAPKLLKIFSWHEMKGMVTHCLGLCTVQCCHSIHVQHKRKIDTMVCLVV